ncbi:MAG: hypothetical protein ABI220_00230 [Candidatus Saccharimonadales bacterium]
MDLDPQLRQLLQAETPYGAVYLRSLGYLGLVPRLEGDKPGGRIYIEGSTKSITSNALELRTHADELAQLASDCSEQRGTDVARKFIKQSVTSAVSDLSRRLPDTPDDMPFEKLNFLTAYPFARALSGGGVQGHFKCKAPWLASDTETELLKVKSFLFPRRFCIPSTPAKDPEVELAELNALPDQRGWAQRVHDRADQEREDKAIEFLTSRGFSVAAMPTE